jgi:aldehyde dehydrogenase (NAD+)
MSNKIMRFGMYLDGRWEPAEKLPQIDVYNPATGEVVATIPEADDFHISHAVETASKGLKVWRGTHPAERARVMFRIGQEIRAHADELANLEVTANGDSLKGALSTVRDVCARRFEYYGGMADKILGSTFVSPGNHLVYTLQEPKGVTAHIVPWNAPLWVGSRSIAPALAAGNSVIVKPSKEAPLSLLRLAELAQESGLPRGVLNVITGTGSGAGETLVRQRGIDAVYFTGSPETARNVLKNVAVSLAHCVLELGGKSPNIVMADADMEAALKGALSAIFANAGQICVAGSRLLVDASIHHEFVDRLVSMARSLTLGGPETGADMGPLISAGQRESVMSYIEQGRSEARLATGGGLPSDEALRHGFFLEPTIFDAVPPDARIAREEIFGPVLVVTPFRNLDEAVEIANCTEYGLASAVWTNDLRTAHATAQRLQAGEVYINHYFTVGFEVTRTPYKTSGLGHSEGQGAIHEYLNSKTVSVKL